MLLVVMMIKNLQFHFKSQDSTNSRSEIFHIIIMFNSLTPGVMSLVIQVF